ncbi:pirin family protein [Aeromicrobium sp. CTD01-1L150]|uniref:pirin family protein n=1 Tax=Aeromicrobium sp. CTD01-1L150 TaxID=3341830 RepID=UPI0035BEF7BB
MPADQLLESRDVPLGGLRGLTVHRTLPQRRIPTIGAWCFVDHFGPTTEPMAVLPHPHTGLQTVTWPLAGTIRHRDNLGSDVVLRPGELNLMTSGDGVSHSEFSVGDPDAPMHGIQLWVALPDATRKGPADFEHVTDLPRAQGPGWSALVIIGTLDGQTSPAHAHTPLLGAQLSVKAGHATIPVDPAFEHGVLAVDGDVRVAGHDVAHRQMQYLAPGRTDIEVASDVDCTLLLIGGEPFEEEIVMWWNFIGRTHEEVVAARQEWEQAAERFGHVDGHGGKVIPAPPLPQVRLAPRRRDA